MKTNNELGAVYLEVEGLDKERFKEIIKGMKVGFKGIEYYINHEEDFIIENWLCFGSYRWISSSNVYSKSRKITLDELEWLLHGNKRTAEVIQAEIDVLQAELEELNKIKEGDIVVTDSNAIGVLEEIGAHDIVLPYRVGGRWYYSVTKIDPSKTVNEILGLINS